MAINNHGSRGRLVQWKSARFVNFCLRGPQFETGHGFIFSDARVFTSRNKVWRKLPTYGHVNQPSRNLDLEKLYATFLLLYEEERSLGNWSYDVIRVRVMSYNLLRYSTHTILATWGGILRVIKPTAENQQRWLKSNASGQAIGKQKQRKRITGWLAGHTIHLETEEVTWIKKNTSFYRSGNLEILNLEINAKTLNLDTD